MPYSCHLEMDFPADKEPHPFPNLLKPGSYQIPTWCDRVGTKKVATASSFPLTALLQEQLSYVQTDHRNMEPRTDAFRFYITDGINRSPTMELPVLIEVRITSNPFLVDHGGISFTKWWPRFRTSTTSHLKSLPILWWCRPPRTRCDSPSTTSKSTTRTQKQQICRWRSYGCRLMVKNTQPRVLKPTQSNTLTSYCHRPIGEVWRVDQQPRSDARGRRVLLPRHVRGRHHLRNLL